MFGDVEEAGSVSAGAYERVPETTVFLTQDMRQPHGASLTIYGQTRVVVFSANVDHFAVSDQY